MNFLSLKTKKPITKLLILVLIIIAHDKIFCNQFMSGYNLSPPATLSSVTIFTWLDYNEDGIKNQTESILNGINLSLYNSNNNLIATGTTDQNGIYVFNNIPNGTYRVKFSRFAGLIYTFPNKGSDDNLDSDINISGYSDIFTIDQASDSYYITGGYRGNLQVFLGNNKSICYGSAVTLDAVPYFGKSPFSYQWDNGLGQNHTVSVTPTTTTTYHVTVTDAWGFSVSNEITIKVKNGVGDEYFTIIDEFSSGNGENNLYIQVSPNDPGPKYIVEYSDQGVISNYRFFSLEHIIGPHPAALEIDFASSYFSHSNDVGTISESRLCYSNNSAGMDFDISGYDYFKLKDFTIDQGVLYAQVSITDINENQSIVTKKIPGLGTSVIFDEEIFLSEFNTSNIDLNHIKEFCFDFSTMDLSIDFRLGDIWLCKFTDCPIKSKPNNIEMCFGDTVEVSAEVDCVSNITYEWDHNLGYGQTHKVSPQNTTTYYVTAIDANGCSSVDTVRVTVHQKPNIILDDYIEMCLGDSIEITAKGAGGDPPYSYIWSTGDTTETIKVSPVANTFYTITISDVNGCTAGEKTIDVIVNPTPSVTATSTIANCTESDGSATAHTLDGTPPYSYIWNTGDTGAILQNIPAGLYYVTVTDSNGCQDSANIFVNEKDCGLIGNFVWEDMNADGIQNINEPPIQNVRTILFDNNNNPLDTAFTDQYGYYYFYSLHQGQYFVKFDNPQNFYPTVKNLGDDKFDSDVDPLSGISDLIELEKYEKDSTVDAGFYQYASIGDTVWVDQNGDNKQNPGEKGIEGFKVKLEDCNGLVLYSVLTDIEGKFNFENLKPGQYRLNFILPDTMKFVEANVGSDSNDSDADPVSGLTSCEELESGEKNTKYDAGVYVPAEIGDYVWEDLNANGIQDENEPGISNIAVILNNCQQNPIDTTYTDNNGYYLFEDLKPGNYKISIIIPQGYEISNPNTTIDDKDSDIENDGFTTCEFLESGEKNNTYDIGLYKFASIGDKVWEDLNANGTQENGESGLGGVIVELRSCNGVLLSSTTTNNSGYYLFDELVPGKYKIKFILPDDYYFSPTNSGPDDVDSDPNTISGLTVCEELFSGENNLNYDGGIYQLAKIGDRVWRDENGDGIQDNNEPGFENVEIVLEDCEGNVISNQFTDSNGNYLFVDLIPGDYRLKFSPPQNYSFTSKDAGEDDLDSDVDPATNLTICETLESGEDNRTIDGGLLYFGSLGDYVWEDINGDGIQQANEPPIENVELRLFFWENGQFIYKSNTFTDNNGYYLFNNLPPGDYYIKIIPPTDYEITLVDKGTDNYLDSDFGDFNGINTTILINLNPGQDDISWDAGLYRCATIGDLLWRDHFRDNVYNVGEAGINGETVNLWKKDDDGNWILWDQVVTSYKPASTCGDGFWSFCTNPGEYFIEFSGLSNTNMVHVTPNVGTDEDIDSDIDDSNGLNTSNVFVLYSGDFIDNLDGGYYPNYTLSGVAWKDDNTNGIKDNNEEVFEGINVELHDNTGIIETQITNSYGEYSFSNLDENQYYLWFELPANYVFTTPNIGNDNNDSDVTDDNGANTTAWIDLENDSLQNINAGYIFQTQKNMIWENIGGVNEDNYNKIWWETKNDESIEYYKIFKGIDENELNKIIKTINSKKSSFNSYQIKDYDIQQIGTYKYKIAGIASDESSIFSNEIVIDVEAKTGISIYPNPTKNILNFDYIGQDNDRISYYLMDLKGKLILKEEGISIDKSVKYSNQLDLEFISDGIYQLLVKTAKNSYILKFAKISN